MPEGRIFDLLVVGGGVNGAAIARDAAMRGLSVLLVEKGDWASGTTAKSSKLAHGGLRYLELLEFGLVHEALHERERLFRLAPHLVRPLRFLYPIYPHVAARRAVRFGLWLYDLLSRGKSVPGRSFVDKATALQMAPGLNPEGLRGAATFYDGQFQHVERLVVEMVWQARQGGATCWNHTRVASLTLDSAAGRVKGATLEDDRGHRFDVAARAVVNAAGAWVDDVLGPLAAGHPPKIRKTKGIHLVVPRFVDVALIVKTAVDGRTFFILPWHDYCLIGTTDTDYYGDADDAVADAADRAYLEAAARRYFPGAPLDRIDYTYAGIRALVNEEGITESNVTRRHVLYDHEGHDGVAGLWTLQGGKLTTARSVAEQIVDAVARRLGRPEAARRHPTREARFPGCPERPWLVFREAAMREAASLAIGPSCAAHLVDVYGARWRDVLASDGRAEARAVIDAGRAHIFAEVTYAVREEDARHVGDFMLRRSDLGHAAGGNFSAAQRVAAWIADLLGWDAARLAHELERYGTESRAFAVPAASTQRLRIP